MAWAFGRYSDNYVVQEGEAQADNLGVHAHDCLAAWAWRADQTRSVVLLLRGYLIMPCLRGSELRVCHVILSVQGCLSSK